MNLPTGKQQSPSQLKASGEKMLKPYKNQKKIYKTLQSDNQHVLKVNLS